MRKVILIIAVLLIAACLHEPEHKRRVLDEEVVADNMQAYLKDKYGILYDINGVRMLDDPTTVCSGSRERLHPERNPFSFWLTSTVRRFGMPGIFPVFITRSKQSVTVHRKAFGKMRRFFPRSSFPIWRSKTATGARIPRFPICSQQSM